MAGRLRHFPHYRSDATCKACQAQTEVDKPVAAGIRVVSGGAHLRLIKHEGVQEQLTPQELARQARQQAREAKRRGKVKQQIQVGLSHAFCDTLHHTLHHLAELGLQEYHRDQAQYHQQYEEARLLLSP